MPSTPHPNLCRRQPGKEHPQTANHTTPRHAPSTEVALKKNILHAPESPPPCLPCLMQPRSHHNE
eukprot:9039860-Alexandrium_andersonii.AAC.1